LNGTCSQTFDYFEYLTIRYRFDFFSQGRSPAELAGRHDKSRTANEAEDIAQDAILNALRRLGYDMDNP
jgi:DNA-directed RNA polymerase specialized sigma24 family protein